MLPELTPELREALNLGISLFAGEAEGRFEELLKSAYAGTPEPIYNYMNDLPGLEGAPPPYLPAGVVRGTRAMRTSFDAGRGCPFLCSFCTIINVQGRKSRSRSADDVEQIVRANLAQGINNFFITDDNLARNQNWETIFDRLIKLREEEGQRFYLMAQVDTMCHKIRGFIEKGRRAGITRVFLGLENINPEALKDARKGQNQITEYRAMLHAASLASRRRADVCRLHLGFSGRYAGVDRARHRHYPTRASHRYPGIFHSYASARFSGS
jgi:radical SAM superfamily enzyme YgiQ (UPF0313 family)